MNYYSFIYVTHTVYFNKYTYLLKLVSFCVATNLVRVEGAIIQD